MQNFSNRVLDDGSGHVQTVLVDDHDRILETLSNGEPITMKDAALRPVNSQKRKKLLDNINHVEVQLARLAKTCRSIRAEVSSLTTED